MGCASSSPFVRSTDGVLTAAKGAATDAVHVGEEAIHDVKDSLNKKVGHVKEAVIGAVQNVGHDIENAFSGSVKKDTQEIGVMDNENIKKITNGTETTMNSSDYKIIPLKDPTEKLIDDALDEISETYDDNVHDVKDMIHDTTDTIKDTATNLSDDVDKILSDSSPNHSSDMDSLKTTSPEPEIELALANKDSNIINPPTPKPTYSELAKLQSVNISDEISSNSGKMIKNIHNRIEQIKDENVGGIYEHQKITDSEIALIREGVAAAAVPGVTGVSSKKEKIVKKPIIRRTKIPDIKKILYKSKIPNGNLSTRWEKRHDKLAQMKITNKILQRRESSDTLWSGSSGEFTKPRTMYLVFGNNFLKTPKIKIIDGNRKASRWMKKEKLDTHELDLYTGITTDNINEPISSRWVAKPLQQLRSRTPELLPSQERPLLNLRPLSQQRSQLGRRSIHPISNQRSISQQHFRTKLRPLSPLKFVRPPQSIQQQKNLQISKKFQNINNEKFRIVDDIDPEADDVNSDKVRKQKASEWLRNNLMEKSFEEIPKINKFADLVDKRIKVSKIENFFNPVKDNTGEEKKEKSFLEINNDIDADRKIRIDGFLDDFRELKKGNSITKFRKADEVKRIPKTNKFNNRESFKKIDNKKMIEKKSKFVDKSRHSRNKNVRETNRI